MTHAEVRRAALSLLKQPEHYLFFPVSETRDISPVDDSSAGMEFAKPEREISDFHRSGSLASWFLAQPRGDTKGSCTSPDLLFSR